MVVVAYATTMAADLTPFGFTTTESLVYTTLLRLGPVTGYAVARAARLARANAYGALDGLVTRGAAARIPGRPARYRPADPQALLTQITAAHGEALDRLDRALPDPARPTEPDPRTPVGARGGVGGGSGGGPPWPFWPLPWRGGPRPFPRALATRPARRSARVSSPSLGPGSATSTPERARPSCSCTASGHRSTPGAVSSNRSCRQGFALLRSTTGDSGGPRSRPPGTATPITSDS